MKLKKLKNLAYLTTASLCVVTPLVSCDSGGGSDTPSEPRIEFPKELQNGDVITFDETTIWTFSNADSFVWDGANNTENTISQFRTNTKEETFRLLDAGISKEGGEATFTERLDVLLEDFDSILRTITLERVQNGEELTGEDLQAIADLINAEAETLGQVIVTYDPETEEIILSTAYDIDFQVTSGIGSFISGSYTGNYTAIETGYLIKFKAPTSAQRASYRLTSDHRLPYVTSSKREITTPIEGDFTWTLSAIAPVEEVTTEAAETTPSE